MNLTGVFAAVPTPFGETDELDIGRMRAAFSKWASSSLSGVVVLGTTGEAGLLNDSECDQVVQEARACFPRSKTLLVGAGRESTRAAREAARRAAECGADAVLVRTPCWFKNQMTTEALVRHFTDVADASPVPVLLYSFPAATGVTLLPQAFALLATHPNIVGMKESSTDIARMSELLSLAPPDFSILTGSGSAFYPALRAGVSGGILALAALLPQVCVRLFDLVRGGRDDEARLLQERLQPIARVAVTEYGVPGVKAAMALLGTDVGRPRPPLMPIDRSAREEIRAVVAEFEGGALERALAQQHERH